MKNDCIACQVGMGLNHTCANGMIPILMKKIDELTNTIVELKKFTEKVDESHTDNLRKIENKINNIATKNRKNFKKNQVWRCLSGGKVIIQDIWDVGVGGILITESGARTYESWDFYGLCMGRYRKDGICQFDIGNLISEPENEDNNAKVD